MPPRYRPEMTQAGLQPTHPVSAHDEYGQARELHIADERPLTIYLDRYEVVTLMTLGTQPELLVLGYLKNQGLVSRLEDIISIQVDWDVAAAAVTTRLGDSDWQEKLGKRTVTTGCGQGTIFGDIMEQLDNIRLTPPPTRQSTIYDLLKNLNAYNEVYRSAGAVHGCALCRETEIVCFIEDVGRHNAVDAIAGHMWLQDMTGQDKIFYTTGRLTSEMVIKVAQMGIPVLLSRSGITRMGLQLARDVGVAMLSRAKGQHFLIYNGREYIELDRKPRPKAAAHPPKRLIAGS
jgi:FdhD protein